MLKEKHKRCSIYITIASTHLGLFSLLPEFGHDARSNWCIGSRHETRWAKLNQLGWRSIAQRLWVWVYGIITLCS
jgi:hypothetical protein